MLKKWCAKNKWILITFAVAYVIMLIAFASVGMKPFGDRQVMVIDSWHQYYPFFQELHHKLQSGESLFYDNGIGLGSNFQLIMSYYAYSPLYFLSVIVPPSFLRIFMMLTTVAKIALAATFFAIYLRYLYKKNNSTIFIFGLLYGFSAYFVGYYWCIMWLDAAALLPLVIMGMHKSLRKEGDVLFAVSLAIAIISNFYAGYMVCEFVAIYYIYLYFTQYRHQGFFKQTAYMLFVSLIAVGISAVVLIPTVKGMSLAYATKINWPKTLTFYRSILDVINGALPFQQPSIRKGLPNIAGGFLMIIGLIYYFKSATIRYKEKIGSVVLLLFLILSFNTNYLDFIWHAFHFPNEIPFRYAFVFSFTALTMAFAGIQSIKNESPSFALGALTVSILYFIFGENGMIERYVALVAIVVSLVLWSIIIQYQRQKLSHKAFTIIISAYVISEVLLTAVIGVHTTGSSSYGGYPVFKHDTLASHQRVREQDPEDYRVELFRMYSTNDSALYGFRGVGVFSSTANAHVTKFLDQLGGVANPASNRYSVNHSSPVLDGMLNVKYFFYRDDNGKRDFISVSPIFTEGKINTYQNNYHLPFAMVVNPSVKNMSTAHDDPFDVQQSFVNRALDKRYKIYQSVEASDVQYDQLEMTSHRGITYHYKNIGNNEKGRVTATLRVQEEGQYNIYVHTYSARDAYFTINHPDGTQIFHEKQETKRGLTFDAGYLEPGSKITVEFETLSGRSDRYKLSIKRIEFDHLNKAFLALAKEPVTFTTFKDGYMEGTVSSESGGLIYTSIPFEAGWTAKIDGKRVATTSIKRAFLCVPVPAGTHKLTLSYVPEGFRSGVMLTLASILSLVIISLPAKKATQKVIRTNAQENEVINIPIVDVKERSHSKIDIIPTRKTTGHMSDALEEKPVVEQDRDPSEESSS